MLKRAARALEEDGTGDGDERRHALLADRVLSLSARSCVAVIDRARAATGTGTGAARRWQGRRQPAPGPGARRGGTKCTWPYVMNRAQVPLWLIPVLTQRRSEDGQVGHGAWSKQPLAQASLVAAVISCHHPCHLLDLPVNPLTLFVEPGAIQYESSDRRLLLSTSTCCSAETTVLGRTAKFGSVPSLDLCHFGSSDLCGERTIVFIVALTFFSIVGESRGAT